METAWNIVEVNYGLHVRLLRRSPETDVSHSPSAAATQYVAKSPVALRIRDTGPGGRVIELFRMRALEQKPGVLERRRQIPPSTLG